MADGTGDPKNRERLMKIAYTCNRVPEHPPETLFEALQSFFFIHVVRYIEYSTLGIGIRFDKLFGPYYENDLKKGKITEEEAMTLLLLVAVKDNELWLV